MLENFYLTLMGAWDSFRASFYLNFIEDDRWHYIVDGLGVTLQITLFAVFLGIVIGLVVGIIRTTYEKTHKLKILNLICGLYLTVIRGTPVVVQLLIMYFVIFGSSRIDKVPVAILAFGIKHTWQKFSAAVSSLWTVDRWRRDAVWVSIISRRCATSFCLRHSKMSYLPCAMSLSLY